VSQEGASGEEPGFEKPTIDEPRSPFSGLGLDSESKEQNKDERLFRKGLGKLLQAAHAYSEAGKMFAKATAALGAELQEFSSMEWMAQQQISHHVSHVGNLMRSLSAIQEKTMLSAQEACDAPMFQLLDLEAKELQNFASRADDAASRQKRKGGSEKFDGENAMMEKNVTQTRNEYEAQIQVLDNTKKIKLCKFLRSLVSVQEEFYKMGNFGMSELEPHVTKLDVDLAELEATQGKRVKDGYVWKLSKKAGKWKRVWLVLRNGSLELRSDSKKKEGGAGGAFGGGGGFGGAGGTFGGTMKRKRMNLLISTVRIPIVPHKAVEGLGGAEKFEFEIVTPERKRGWIFSVKVDQERTEWIEALQASIGSLINNQQLQQEGGAGAAGEDRKSNHRGAPGNSGIGMAIIRKVIPKGHRKSRSVTSAETARMMAMSLMQEGTESSVMAELSVVPGNDRCVDCGKNDPDWASLNLGVLFCLNCSGIHRHLGSHISKVRSVTMDKWPEATLRYMKCIGNRRANEFWEAHLDPETTSKLEPTSTQQERTEFITAKYAKKEFVPLCPLDSKEEKSAALFSHIKEMAMTVITPSPSSSTPGTPTPGTPTRTPDPTRRGLGQSSGSLHGSFEDKPSVFVGVQREDQMSASGPVPPVSPRSKSPPNHSTSESGSLRNSLNEDIPSFRKPSLIAIETLKDLVWPMYELLAWGADILAVDGEAKRTLGQVLLEKKDAWLFHMFILQGMEVDHVDEATGDSLLHFAARYNLYECLNVLFSHGGASLAPLFQLKNHDGKLPVDLAKEHRSFRVLEMYVVREDKEKLEAPPPIMPIPIPVDGGDPPGDKKSPRGKFGGGARSNFSSNSNDNNTGAGAEFYASSSDIEGKTGMQKFLKKAQTHVRSKSVFQGPTQPPHNVRESGSAKTNKHKMFSKDGPGEKGGAKRAVPELSSKPTATTTTRISPDSQKMKADEGEHDDNRARSASPLRQSFQKFGEEVIAREGKNPLMKGKGLDLDAIKVAQSSTDLAQLEVEADERNVDLLDMISSESSQ
jgi:hypothetical protein